MADVLFLPGIVAPAATRYAPLLAELPGVHGVPKDLELYRETVPPEAYSIVTEVEGIDRAVDDEDFDRFHLYGHSAGGAIAWPTSPCTRTGCSAWRSMSPRWSSPRKASRRTGGR